jgi:hypothetical protein
MHWTELMAEGIRNTYTSGASRSFQSSYPWHPASWSNPALDTDTCPDPLP